LKTQILIEVEIKGGKLTVDKDTNLNDLVKVLNDDFRTISINCQ